MIGSHAFLPTVLICVSVNGTDNHGSSFELLPIRVKVYRLVLYAGVKKNTLFHTRTTETL